MLGSTSPFYRHWFKENNIRPEEIRVHEDLLSLPIVSGHTIREHQPPAKEGFSFLSADWQDIFSIQETSGTSGNPKSFFLTWEDWKRYAEKYARSFVSQGFSKKDKVVVCASYGMNVGANTMTIAAKKIGMGIIPLGKCTFEARVLKNYRPTCDRGQRFQASPARPPSFCRRDPAAGDFDRQARCRWREFCGRVPGIPGRTLGLPGVQYVREHGRDDVRGVYEDRRPPCPGRSRPP